MLAFAHIPAGTTANREIDIDGVKSRIVTLGSASTAIGAGIETRGASPNGRLYSELNRVASELAPRIVQDLPQHEWWGWASVYDQAIV
jgi:hypothetical protein